MNPVQKSLSKLFGARLAVRDTVDDGHCDCIEGRREFRTS